MRLRLMVGMESSGFRASVVGCPLSYCVGAFFFRLAATIGTLLLRLVVWVCFLVVVAALATEKEQNLLSVRTAHAVSLRGWPRAVKHTTLPQGEIPP